MRYGLSVGLGVLASCLVAFPSFAGNVLVPKENNIGLLPSTAATATPEESSKEAPAAPALPNTPQSSSSDKKAPLGVATPDPPKKPKLKMTRKPHYLPTSVIRTEAYPDITDPTLPNRMRISFSEKSSLSKQDAKTLEKILGLSPKQIAQDCYLSSYGLILTDKGSYQVGRGLDPAVTVAYAGTIKSYSLRARAMCVVRKDLPATSGQLIMIKDRFAVLLRTLSCQPPDRRAGEMVVTYTGSSKTTTCDYKD
jgi:hypothetical protein